MNLDDFNEILENSTVKVLSEMYGMVVAELHLRKEYPTPPVVLMLKMEAN